MAISEKTGFIVFSDLKGFSKLEPDEQERYLAIYVHLLSRTIKPLLDKAFVSNTWGDAIIAVFEDGMEAAEFMLGYRREAEKSLGSVSDKKVLPRIAGHYGTIHVFEDPLLNRNNTISDEVNTAARIEPVTRPGEIFVSQEFKDAFLESVKQKDRVKFEGLGKIPLAKGHGERVLYRLIKKNERAHIIDTLFEMGLPNALPDEPLLSEREASIIKALEGMEEREKIQAVLAKESLVKHTGLFSYEMAKICKKAGFYREGLTWIEKARDESVMASGIELFPFKTKREVIKLKADLLTRLDLYSESAEILYSLWRNIEDQNAKDASDILAMLAAQFKRRALLKDNRVLSKDEIDREMLEKAAGLYLEAFRHNIEDYYPAINAAYLLVILGGKEAQSGKKLAQYINSTWENELRSNHWLDFTLAQTKLLQGLYDEALGDMEYALAEHADSIGVFDIEATKLQITQFLMIIGEMEEGQEIVDLLEHHMKIKQVQ